MPERLKSGSTGQYYPYLLHVGQIRPELADDTDSSEHGLKDDYTADFRLR